jgi:pyridoxamine 5'-phosphate oxidase
MTDLLAPDLLATFDALFAEAEAAGEPDPTAMTLASADAGGRPAARTVLLKAHDARGFVLLHHLDGRKGRELQANPQAALLFHWKARARRRAGADRGRGRVVGDAEADAYFAIAPARQPDRAVGLAQSETLDRATPSNQRIARFERSSRAARCRARRAGAGFRVVPDRRRVLVRRAIPPARALAVRTRCRRHEWSKRMLYP